MTTEDAQPGPLPNADAAPRSGRLGSPPEPAHSDYDAIKASVDWAAFTKELKAIRRELRAEMSDADFAHLRKIERWGRLAALGGYATAWIAPNPLSAALLGLASSTRWLLMHHIGHRGYDKVPGTPERYKSKRFAMGWRRPLDWLDWIDPEAWNHEHNTLHHANTGQEHDPDLLERNLEFIRHSGWPLWKRYAAMLVLASSWRLLYYAPSTLRELRAHQRGKAVAEVEHDTPGLGDFFDLRRAAVRDLWARCVLPQGLVRFVLIPALYAPLGPWASLSVAINTAMAEVVTNLHTFAVVGPNHTGDDLHRFEFAPEDQAEWVLHQILGSTNYRTGGDLNDYAHLWLNYQIEHHLWPNLPMSAYQRAQPRVEALCNRHGVPYIQESVWTRVRKMLDVCVGKRSMLRAHTGSDPPSR